MADTINQLHVVELYSDNLAVAQVGFRAKYLDCLLNASRWGKAENAADFFESTLSSQEQWSQSNVIGNQW